MKHRDFTDYINDILSSIEEVSEFTSGMSPDDLRSKAPHVPWNKMTGMRNKLIHEYFGVDLDIVWTVIKEELPPLSSPLKKLLAETIE